MKRTTLFAATFAALLSAPALAQFDLGNLLDKAKKVTEVASEGADDQEAGLGRQWAATLLGAAPLVDNEALQRYVNRVGLYLAMHAERPELAWRFGVLDSDNINAFATPGGYVLVTRGLLARLRSEAELAGVLAHEIAHVVERHHLKAMRKGKGLKLGGELLSEFGLKGKGSAEVNDKLISSAKEVMERGLDKSDEYEADRMAVVIAARAGYDPFGLPQVLQTLAALNAQDGSLALLFATHPAPEARLQALDKAIGDRLDAYAGAPDVTERYLKTVTKK